MASLLHQILLLLFCLLILMMFQHPDSIQQIAGQCSGSELELSRQEFGHLHGLYTRRIKSDFFHWFLITLHIVLFNEIPFKINIHSVSGAGRCCYWTFLFCIYIYIYLLQYLNVITTSIKFDSNLNKKLYFIRLNFWYHFLLYSFLFCFLSSNWSSNRIL